MNNIEIKVISDLKLIKNKISNLSKELVNLERQKKKLEKKCFNICNHSFIRIEDANYNDLCKYICSKCNCYNLKHIYN